MMPITLEATPNYETQFLADGQQYDIRIWFNGNDLMLMDIAINGSQIAYSLPCLVGQMVIPYPYLEGAGGNFFWTTASGNNPNYLNFGAGDVLLYASNAEMSQGRAEMVAAANTITLTSTQAN